MKALFGVFAGLGLIGVLLGVGLGIFALICTVYGLWLAFSASIILGIIVLLVEPSPFIIGLVMIAFNKNLAQMLVDLLNK